jgi:hypothetical protein
MAMREYRLLARAHLALKGKTPAQAAGLDVKADWGDLIQEATVSKTKRQARVPTEEIEVIAR